MKGHDNYFSGAFITEIEPVCCTLQHVSIVFYSFLPILPSLMKLFMSPSQDHFFLNVIKAKFHFPL